MPSTRLDRIDDAMGHQKEEANVSQGGQSILAIIPARGGSKSIPMKNITLLAGSPLIAYSIEVAKKSRLISRVIVTTDSNEIRELSLALGAEVPFLRPQCLADDQSPDLPVFLHALEWLVENEGYVPDIVVHLRPTTPLRRVERIDEAIQLLMDNPDADAVRGVSAAHQNPFKMWMLEDPYLKPLIDTKTPEAYNQPRQTLPPVYWQNGYIDVVRASTLLNKKSMTGERILPYVIDQFVVDIDQHFSLKLAEYLMESGEY